ncbi:MAG TPA: T9SS type A sorting domain-containing protein [Saprospiraceae bacterium]|nr:T9SS type A sorting domain-containing protein [Saprospiraceae bacterium]
MRKLICFLTIAISISTAPLFSQSGTLDPTFGVDGIEKTDIGSSFDIMRAITIQPDQKLLAVGSSGSGGSADIVVVRYLPDGSPDPDFGANGIARMDFDGLPSTGYAIALQPDGQIVLAGYTSNNNNIDFALSRLNPDGTQDTTFSHDGNVTTDLGTTYEFPNSVVIQEDGKIIAAGKITSNTFSDFVMVRYLANGELDSVFGNNGIVTTSLRDEDEVTAAAIQPDGKIILSGFAAIAAKGDFAMVRYFEDGTVDKFFGTGGKVFTDLEGAGRSDFSTSMLLEPNGNIVLAGAANFDNMFIESDIGVVRYDQDGNPDKSFGDQGIFILKLGGNTQAQDIARQPDGKYIVAGKSNFVFSHNQWLMFRLNPDGEIDTKFGDLGLTVTDLDGESESASGIEIQNDSRIVMGGYNGDFTKLDFVMARYIADFVMDAFIGPEITCHSGSDGSLVVVVTDGGVPPYSYSLDGINFQSGATFDGLPAGTYTVTVKDSQSPGVTGTIGPITIADAPEPPLVYYQITDNDLDIIIDEPGIYFFSINGSAFGPDFLFPDLPDGTYHVVVIDQNGCVIYENDIDIQFTAVIEPDHFPVSVFPNPCKDFLTIGSGVKNAKMNVSTLDITGQLLNNLTATSDAEGSLKLDVSNLTNGIYFIKIKTGNLETRRAFVVVR